jgi:hypothetical protein
MRAFSSGHRYVGISYYFLFKICLKEKKGGQIGQHRIKMGALC